MLSMLNLNIEQAGGFSSDSFDQDYRILGYFFTYEIDFLVLFENISKFSNPNPQFSDLEHPKSKSVGPRPNPFHSCTWEDYTKPGRRKNLLGS